MRFVNLASRPTADHWFAAAERAYADAEAFDRTGNYTLADLRSRDGRFCLRQARQMQGPMTEAERMQLRQILADALAKANAAGAAP